MSIVFPVIAFVVGRLWVVTVRRKDFGDEEPEPHGLAHAFTGAPGPPLYAAAAEGPSDAQLRAVDARMRAGEITAAQGQVDLEPILHELWDEAT